MTAEKAIYNFFTSFGLTVLRDGSIYSGTAKAKLPYILLPDFTPDSAGEKGERSLEIWYRDGEDWASPQSIVTLIATAIPLSGKTLTCDTGVIHLRRGKPFIKYLPQRKDNSLKGLSINISYEYSESASKLLFKVGSSVFTVSSDSEVIINKSLLGGRAVSVSGLTSFDYIGVRTQIKVLSDWITAQEYNTFCAMAAASPLMVIEFPDDDSTDDDAVQTKYIVDMPTIKQVSRNSIDGECYKIEINAVSGEAI